MSTESAVPWFCTSRVRNEAKRISSLDETPVWKRAGRNSVLNRKHPYCISHVKILLWLLQSLYQEQFRKWLSVVSMRRRVVGRSTSGDWSTDSVWLTTMRRFLLFLLVTSRYLNIIKPYTTRSIWESESRTECTLSPIRFFVWETVHDYTMTN